MKKILLNIRQIEKVVLNVGVDNARLMVINENHDKIYEQAAIAGIEYIIENLI